MKKIIATIFLASFAAGLLAQGSPDADFTSTPENPRRIYFPAQGVERKLGTLGAVNLTNNGGPVITAAHVVFIFWGPSFANVASADHTYATTLQAFRNQFGTTAEYHTITQYCGSNGCIGLTNLAAGSADWFDYLTTPPIAVTDSNVQAEVNKYLGNHAKDDNAIYEVVIPSTSYSTDGVGTSCGGPALAYCAYHSWIGSGTTAIKYSIEPYPSCGGCKFTGWSDVQNQERFVCHETREAVTDPTGHTWRDNSSQEADDKCAWSPTPFLSGGFGYQYEWSNALSACVQTNCIPNPRPICTQQYNPVLCNNGVVYTNGCLATAACAFDCVPAGGGTTQ
jgi:hypothetical protein